jgi:hypothetical protein
MTSRPWLPLPLWLFATTPLIEFVGELDCLLKYLHRPLYLFLLAHEPVPVGQ